MPDHVTITDAADPRSLDIGRRRTQYLLSQLLRLVCIVLIIINDQWFLRILLALAALLLPWVAVLRANDDRNRHKPSTHLYHQLPARDKNRPASPETDPPADNIVVNIVDEKGALTAIRATLFATNPEAASYPQEKQQ